MRTITSSEKERDGMGVEWRIVKCDECDGRGVVSSYTLGGTDFEGAKVCPTCRGNGQLYITPTGRIAQYPGGRFVGRATTEEYANAAALTK